MFGALGAVLSRQYKYCGLNVGNDPQKLGVQREAMRAQLARLGVPTFPGLPWQPSEQKAWNDFNVSQGLKPMLFGNYPMGTQCDALYRARTKYQSSPLGADEEVAVAVPPVEAIVAAPGVSMTSALAIGLAGGVIGYMLRGK